ncbi:hypothetical protein [Maioricimonas sp. JC845]|uniref:hypothetical protein n=1 Tax=Maioricimonas sp. JC845 TaxID=3232138 RepID=UPI00345865D8
MSMMTTTVRLLALLCLMSTFTTESNADIWGDIAGKGRDFDQNRLDYMTPPTHPRAGRDYTKFYVHNGTGRTQWISVERHNDLGEYVSGYGANYWQTLGWYRLEPNQRMHVTNVTGRFTYVQLWGGSRYTADIGSRHWREFTFNLR